MRTVAHSLGGEARRSFTLPVHSHRMSSKAHCMREAGAVVNLKKRTE